MLAEQSLRDGNLEESLRNLQRQIRQEPAKAAYRTFLFQLLAVLGDWDRALAQLIVAGELDAAAVPMVQTYRHALHCEVLREQVFAGTRAPWVMGEPVAWLALMFEALRLEGEGNSPAASAAREAALAAAPATSGTIDGEPFEWIADASDRQGPTLEVILPAGYYWVPFSRVKRIEMEPPSDLRDRVWTPAVFTWSNDGQAAGLIPTRYAGTTAIAEPPLQLARETRWIDRDSQASQPAGQRMFVTDTNDYALLDVRTLELSDG